MNAGVATADGGLLLAARPWVGRDAAMSRSDIPGPIHVLWTCPDRPSRKPTRDDVVDFHVLESDASPTDVAPSAIHSVKQADVNDSYAPDLTHKAHLEQSPRLCLGDQLVEPGAADLELRGDLDLRVARFHHLDDLDKPLVGTLLQATIPIMHDEIV